MPLTAITIGGDGTFAFSAAHTGITTAPSSRCTATHSPSPSACTATLTRPACSWTSAS